jgi:succinoglycan biosynthesis transport protein ExoP
MNLADTLRAGALPPQADISADISRLIAIFRRRWPIILSVAAIVLSLVVFVTLRMTPQYVGVASVLIDTRQHASGLDVDAISGGWQSDSSIIDTEVQILKSRSLADRVVDTLKLDSDPEFNGAQHMHPGLMRMLKARLQALQGHGAATPGLPPSGEAQLIHEAVVDQVLSRLSVGRSGGTYVVDIAFQSEDPAKAALIANAFADKYLLEQIEAKYDAAQRATVWLNQRLAELQPQVEQAEAAVQQYKAQHGLLAAVGSSLTQQEISNLNTSLDAAKADVAEKDARVASAQQEAQAGGTGENLTGVLSSPTIIGLRAQQSSASSKIAQLETKYGPKHPEVQRAQKELADTNAQITEEMARDVANLQSEDQVAHQRLASLEGSLSGAKGTLIGNNAASVQLDDLQRRADAASTLYQSLLNRAKQTSIDQGGQQSDARVVSHAKIPTRASTPNVPANLALGMILGLAAGVGSVVLLELLNSGLGTSEDVERRFNVPYLGTVPLLESTLDGGRKKALPLAEYVMRNPLSAFAESLRNLRASIIFSKVDSPVKVIGITSALPSEGKSTTAVCLGQAMALAGSKVVVVDCDLRHASISRSLAEHPVGLVEVLQGAAKLEEALVRDERSGTWFLPVSTANYTPKDLFGSAAMDRLIQELRQKFEFILLDTAPVVAVADTRVLASKCDVVILLVKWRKTPRKAVQLALSLLASVGADVAGIALTLVNARDQSRYGYGDAGYYYKSVQNYYTQEQPRSARDGAATRRPRQSAL